MKIKLLLFLLIAFQVTAAHAGRETHGLIETDIMFKCQGDGLAVDMSSKMGLVVKATIIEKDQKPLDFSCKDRINSIKLKEPPQLTVVCKSVEEAPYRLELRESLKQTKLKIFDLEQKSVLELDCF